MSNLRFRFWFWFLLKEIGMTSFSHVTVKGIELYKTATNVNGGVSTQIKSTCQELTRLKFTERLAVNYLYLMNVEKLVGHQISRQSDDTWQAGRQALIS